jgi:branched-chain amino acid transport system ATP-binding protein
MITVSGLNAGYGKLVVLHDLRVHLGANQFTAVLGPNGSGKSTLLKTIMGITDVFSGSIRFRDRELIGTPTEAMSRLGIAYVAQRSNVFTAMTVGENLLLATRGQPKTTAGQALAEAYALFPILSKRQHQRAEQLSGGERQMLAVALGWLLRPQVMLLDEPSAGLSPLVTSEVFGVLKTLSEQNITLVVVEQNARSVLQWCSDVIVLREGTLVYQATAEECRADEEMLKTYLSVGANKTSNSHTKR